MSTGILAAPDLSLNVRYTRKVQENRGEVEEHQVEILEDEEHHADLGSQKADISAILEKDQLQRTYDNLRNNHSQFQDEVKQLQGQKSGKCCPEGWKRFGCSCYFKSSEKKTWEESRKDCQNKGGDLVIINNKEEQNFVIGLNMDGESWIGLKTQWKNSRWEWEWEWVDKSPLTEKFWAAGSPLDVTYQYRAAYCDQQGRWIQREYYQQKNWICEK